VGSVHQLEEADTIEMLNTDNDSPVIQSLSDGKIAEMVLNTNKHEDGDNEDCDILHMKKSPYTVW